MKKKSIILLFLIETLTLSAQQKKEITLEDLWQKNTFAVKRIEDIRSMKNGEHYTILTNTKTEQAIVMYEYKTGNAIDTVLKSSWLKVKGQETKKIGIEGYEFSADESKLLVFDESEQIY